MDTFHLWSFHSLVQILHHLIRKAILIESIKFDSSFEGSVAVYDTIGAFLFPGDAVHLISVALDVVHRVRNHNDPTHKILLDFEFDSASCDLLLVGVYVDC